MKILYIECNMGAAGDMLTAALSELLPDNIDFIKIIGAAGIPNVEITKKDMIKRGIRGTAIDVRVRGESEDEHNHCGTENHRHSSIRDIEHIIERLNLSEPVKKNAFAVYRHIAEAESSVHGTKVSEVHFHEVGAMDAVTDIVSVCMLMDSISPDKVVVSPINVGSGTVRCAHGVLPVPSPAAALLLKGAPVYGDNTCGELCTPTGAALLTHFADSFGPMPIMSIEKIGVGMGKKDFDAANCVRVFLGEAYERDSKITELCANVDDMTGEEISFAVDRLLKGGARDAFWTSVGMKKGRPGVMITCVCDESFKDKMLELFFRHTTTIGVREKSVNRYIMNRKEIASDTAYGKVRIKESSGFGASKAKPEYDDIADIARKNDMSLYEVKKLIDL